jgi:hypothetical protein
MEDNDFIQGLYVQKPMQPFIKACFGLKKDEFTEFMRDALNNPDLWKINEKDGSEWLNIDILESKEGKLYAKINKFVPKKEEAPF